MKSLFEEATWTLMVEEDSGKHYWYGICSDDKEGTKLDVDEPLILAPKHFSAGYKVICESIG